jgi:uncharacterized repeat protein (TIGR03803 family)
MLRTARPASTRSISISTLLALLLALSMAGTARSAPAATDPSRVLHAFRGTDGDEPTFVIQRRDGSVWGVTFLGGGTGLGSGVLYSIASGRFSVVHTFTDTPDGSLPSRLIEASDGLLYGLTASGGPSSNGTVYTVDRAGAYRILHGFSGGADGSAPNDLIETSPGTFYGTTSQGGNPDVCPNHEPQGTAFRMDAAGTVTTLHTFCENVDGSIPNGILLAGDGNFYGTAFEDGPLPGGALGGGTFWRMTPAGDVTVLQTFDVVHVGDDNVNEPRTGLLLGPDGNFYGSANGGFNSLGALFRADTSGNVVTIHSFGFGDEGHDPGPLSLGRDGRLYGTNREGGADIVGTVYRADLNGTVTVLHTFTGDDGSTPASAPFPGRGGIVYATAIFEGPRHHGTLIAVKA